MYGRRDVVDTGVEGVREEEGDAKAGAFDGCTGAVLRRRSVNGKASEGILANGGGVKTLGEVRFTFKNRSAR